MSLPLTISAAEKRCGWLENPSPANLWLIDAQSEWTISIQGFPMDDEDSLAKMPALDKKEFIRTNGEYGFACVCLDVDSDKEASAITRVHGGKQLLLKTCLEDPSINKRSPLR